MRSHLKLAVLGAALALFAGGCGGDKQDGGAAANGAQPGGSDAPAAGTKQYVAADSTGVIKGTVKWGTGATEQVMIQKSSDRVCADHGTEADPKYQVNEDGTVPHVFVWVLKGPVDGMTGFPMDPVVVDQVGCMYRPHVIAAASGQEIQIKNSDGTTHNVRASPRKNKPINFTQPEGKVDAVTFTAKEKAIHLVCDIHSWMSGYVWVLDHPFWSTTGEDGSFEIKGLPAGDYTIKVWHENDAWKFPKDEFQVTVGKGETKTVADITIGK